MRELEIKTARMLEAEVVKYQGKKLYQNRMGFMQHHKKEVLKQHIEEAIKRVATTNWLFCYTRGLKSSFRELSCDVWDYSFHLEVGAQIGVSPDGSPITAERLIIFEELLVRRLTDQVARLKQRTIRGIIIYRFEVYLRKILGKYFYRK